MTKYSSFARAQGQPGAWPSTSPGARPPGAAGFSAQGAPGPCLDPGTFQAAEALYLALRSSEPERRRRAVTDCLFDCYWGIGQRVGTEQLPPKWVGVMADYDAVLAASPEAQAELDYQEAVLQEIERTGEPITQAQAAP